MPEKDTEKKSTVARWIHYLYAKIKKDDEEIAKLKAEIADMKKKEELLGKSVLNLYEKK